MDEYQSPKILELWNSEVRSLNCAHTFVAEKTDANMSLIDHRDIIVAIADSHCDQTFVMHLDHADHISLLLWRDSTADHRLARLANPDEVAPESFIVTDVG